MNQHPRDLDRPHLVREAFGAIAVNTNLLFVPPDRTHIELLSLRISFASDANAANRLMLPIIGPVGQDDFGFPCPVVQVANRAYEYYWSRDTGCFLIANFANYWTGPLPSGFVWASDAQLRTDIQNMQVGDQITAYTLRYMMWRDPVII